MQYELKGTFFECCRVEDGHCALWLGGDLPQPCTNLQTYHVQDGEIDGVGVSGLWIMLHHNGIGPRHADLAAGVSEGAAYIDARANPRQREVLLPFVGTALGIRPWKQDLGVRFVPFEVSADDGMHRICTPYAEQKIALTVGGDRRTPIRLANARSSTLHDVNLGRTERWWYRDYGKDLAFQGTSGAIASFVRRTGAQ